MINWIERMLKELNLVESMDQPNGFTRLSYSEGEDRSIEVFKKEAESLGLQVSEDSAGNVIARWEGKRKDAPIVATGSHLDTVSQGGGYDGVAGIISSLGGVKQLMEEGFEPDCPIEVLNFRSEESSRFGVSTIGSKAMSGKLDLSIGKVEDAEGITIKEAAESRGYVWESFIEADKKEDIKSFVELHIEQGMNIEENEKDFGVVRSVACPVRLKVTIEGKASHTGTTPMNRRQDALVAVAPLVSFVSQKAGSIAGDEGEQLVATVSTIDLVPNSMNVIPGKVELGVDIRSVDDSLKHEIKKQIEDKCREIEDQHKVAISTEVLVDNDSIDLDEGVQSRLMEAGEASGLEGLMMNSGAGHDVMNMQAKCPSGLIFIPCKDGLSHHPGEFASLEDIQKGMHVLTNFLRNEASE
ncbi:Zn-dependent hydrolase [Halalkalibacillus sediminis]|uniref:Zn-dependent hydrolase n=1 Tax=Halalkalibacillus sediminis TaxID=2018042 RepID=A0A2I0QUV1_9BACI|nr:M20 family metallo-hydrolase [Halalkalibacillus sediminis]PKR77870.1 Zn-dependent hydrolase [Halalkalibacillus sediminis]